MKCDKCGKLLLNSIYRYGSSVLCEDCAREMGLPTPESFAENALRLLDGDFRMLKALEFSPTRSQIKCPKCGMSLSEFDSTGKLGCIECYNTFSEPVMRLLMRSQANTRYTGRSPGNLSAVSSLGSEDLGETEVEEEQAPEPSKMSATDEERLQRYANADIGMLTEEDLREGIKLAVASEDYLLAARFRDELKGREGI